MRAASPGFNGTAILRAGSWTGRRRFRCGPGSTA